MRLLQGAKSHHHTIILKSLSETSLVSVLQNQSSSEPSLHVDENASTILHSVTTRWATMRKLKNSMVIAVAELHVIRKLTLPSGLLLEKEPTNMQAQSLSNLIEKKVTRGMLDSLQLSSSVVNKVVYCVDGYIGMAMVGGIAAVSALVATALIRRATRK